MTAGRPGFQEHISRYRARLAMVVLMIVCLYFLVIFGEQAWRANQLEADVAQQRDAIAAIRRENAALATEAEMLNSPAYAGYVERIARRDLGLARPGDTVLLVPREQTLNAPAPQATPEPPDDRQNWQRWIDVLLGQ